MFKSLRRNGRNKGLRMKHVIQMSMLLGVSIWLLYQIHNSDGKKSSVTTNISYKLLNNSDGSKDISKLGRKVLRPKVKETKEHHEADGEEKNENEGSYDVVEDHESDEHEEVVESGRADGKEDGEEMKEHENENEFDEEIKPKVNENARNEQNEKKMSPNLKDVGKSVPSDDIDDGDDGQSVRGEVENDKISGEEPSVDHSERDSKKLTTQRMNYAPDSYSHKTNTAKFIISTGNGNTTNVKAEFEQKDEGLVLEEEKDALTDLETLPESGTGGSITHENVATE